MSLECRMYTDRDFEAVKSWYSFRDMRLVIEDLPKLGFIVPGIAAGFLMQTDTTACILEPFIANPNTTKEEREAALELIMGDLIIEAQDLGYTRIFGFSSNQPMLRRALNWGFEILETSTTVVKELE